MTQSTNLSRLVERKRSRHAPNTLSDQSVSVIVPVRNNRSGVERLLYSIAVDASAKYREVIVIDDGSDLEPVFHSRLNGTPLYVFRTPSYGPANARNIGISQARGEWLLFLDSDCIVEPGLLTEYEAALNGSVAYAGRIAARGNAWFAKYYDTAATLIPAGVLDDGEPNYVVTANALVWSKAAREIGGFDTQFRFAGGEDVDFGIRLWGIGSLTYVPKAVVHHDFGSMFAFSRRFFRYGRAHAVLARKYEFNGWTTLAQEHPTSSSRLLNSVRLLFTSLGYLSERTLLWIYQPST